MILDFNSAPLSQNCSYRVILNLFFDEAVKPRPLKGSSKAQ